MFLVCGAFTRLLCAAVGTQIDSATVRLRLNSILKLLQEALEEFHGQAHYVCQAAGDFLNEFVAGLFYGVSTGFVPP